MSFSYLTPGTPIVWTNSGSPAIAATGLASGAGAQGDKSPTLLDATKGLAEWLYCVASTYFISAPADLQGVEWWLGWSNSATPAGNNPGGLTGVSGTLASPGSVKNLLSYIGAIITSNAIGTGLQTQDAFWVRVKNSFFIPVIVNNSGVALSSGANSTSFSVTPFYRTIV
jgi:hypothetical protein